MLYVPIWMISVCTRGDIHPTIRRAEPSNADQTLTQTLKTALGLVDVRVLDHFVVTAGACRSMAELGLV